MAETLDVAIAAGGTAGHINPALALAEELRDRGHRVTFFGQPHKLEGTLVPQAGFELVPIHVSGFDRSRPWTAASAIARMVRARSLIGRHMGRVGTPDVAVGFGAYVEVPLLQWAHGHGVATMVHEQNSVAGLANRLMARTADAVALGIPEAARAFEGALGPQAQVVVTGNPVRRQVVEGDRARGRRDLSIPEDATVLLVFGGSLGAQSLNDAVVALKDELLAIPDLHVIHSTGKEGHDEVLRALDLTADEAARWHVSPYIDAMGDTLAAADLVLSRAGASSIAEIAAVGVPAILVPYPHATADHQTVNARFLAGAGAAELVADDELQGEDFHDLLLGLVSDGERRDAMARASRELGQARSAARLADETEKLGKRSL